MTTPAAADVTVDRCVVRVVRRGGWSWGPDPRDLVRQVVDALPALLAERFAEHLAAEGPDLEITEPVHVTVRWGRPRPGAAPEVVLVATPAAPDPVAAAPGGLADEPAAALVPAGEVTAAALFAELAERDELAALLALLPDAVFVVYASALLDHAPPGAAEPVVDALLAELTRRARRNPLAEPGTEAPREPPDAAPPPAPPVDRAGALRLLGALRTTPSPDTADAAAPGTGTGGGPGTAGPDARVPVPPSPAYTAAPAGTAAVGETRTCAALPFLLLAPLARTGYLSAVGPALAGLDLLAEAPLFAAALAYKVLGAPDRGWRRTGADHATAAAFAGLETAPDLDGFARRVRHALPVLDGVLALTVCRGHDPADPLLVTGTDTGLLLVDAQGCFPIAWAPDVAGLLPHWTACGRPPVAVCDSPLPAGCLRDLAAAGVGFVTDVRPLRGDPLTRLPWRTPLWTTGHVDPGLAAALPAHRDRVTEVVRELFTARRVVPRAAGALDRTAALAASLGLGVLAWTLWRDRETTDPVTALTRLADLEATVRYDRETVRVALPLGRRHADLLRHGALTDVHDVVWLGGRTLTFSGG